MNQQALKENGRKGGQKRAADYHQRFETVIHFPDGISFVVRERRVVAVEPKEFSYGWVHGTLASRPQVGRWLKVVIAEGLVSGTPAPVISIERRPVQAQPAANAVQP